MLKAAGVFFVLSIGSRVTEFANVQPPFDTIAAVAFFVSSILFVVCLLLGVLAREPD